MGQEEFVVELDILKDIISNKPSNIIEPKEFFVAYGAIPVFVFTGFSPTLCAIKKEIKKRVCGLAEENLGSRWSKVSLGALNSGEKLTSDDVYKIQGICGKFNEIIQKSSSKRIEVRKLSLVIFECRSLERRLISGYINLVNDIDMAPPTPEAMAKVEEVTAPLHEQTLTQEYIDGLELKGRNIDYYREAHYEATLVFDLEDQQPDYIDDFTKEIDKVVPKYAWFAKSSRHMTLRALVSKK